MRVASLLLIVLCLPVAGIPPAATAESELVNEIQAGTFLVAARTMPDPRFRETVILLLEHDENGTLGLVVNRITGVTLGEALPDWADLDDRKHFLFLGGPVQMTALSYLLADSDGHEGSLWALGGVVGGVDADALRELLKQDMPVQRLRVYLGYAGWGPGQLASELDRDDWHLFRADPQLVFDPAPDTLWPQFMQQIDRPWI